MFVSPHREVRDSAANLDSGRGVVGAAVPQHDEEEGGISLDNVNLNDAPSLRAPPRPPISHSITWVGYAFLRLLIAVYIVWYVDTPVQISPSSPFPIPP